MRSTSMFTQRGLATYEEDMTFDAAIELRCSGACRCR